MMQALEKNSASSRSLREEADEASARTRALQAIWLSSSPALQGSPTMTTYLLLIPQRRDRIHAAGAARGNYACECRHGTQNQYDARDGDPIHCSNSV